jgi:hypothetical protein
VQFVGLLSATGAANLARMEPAIPNRAVSVAADILPPDPPSAASMPAPTPAGHAALEAPSLACSVARAMAHKATAAATLRAYKADWTHFSQ